MHYLSTRGGVTSIGFADAVTMGLATDGGLLVPAELPRVDAATLRAWSQLSFQELALEVFTPFVGDEIPREDLRALIDRSYAGFSHPEVTPVVEAGGARILELFHGPTAAFKDVALQFLGNLFEYLLARDGGELNIVGATSGDTGSAAIYGVRGKARIRVFILHPKGRVSPIQARQMTTVLDDNVHNIAVEGTFDDAQRIVKTLFSDLPFKRSHHLGAVNSINWARILAQMVYYFYAWGRVSGGDPERAVSFSVPTGNFGDVFAGYLARRMGLPVRRLVIATNRNDILTRFVDSGVYAAESQVHRTLSPAMDIQLASNFERYLYFLHDGDCARVRALFEGLREHGRIELDAERHARVRADFDARAASDAETLEQIRASYECDGYICCPHTAVGLHAARGMDDAICLATAHPAKFNEAVEQAIGQGAPLPPSLQGLMEREQRCVELPATVEAIKAEIERTLAATGAGA
ncbi:MULTISPECIES: threonine synthase [Marichromatium]|uniref:Threonine synthase n=1 Tax=Marichromatium gracile TaxID=1048 RepID=A0A4R4AGB5_MARGR|nr:MULTISPECIES: threonine synthase [Marichromatium]MBK1710139.1 threonine synthase [Marichromatium gracile]RNE89122.1 threonine synthase [Marichromatium sp. AB31]TCW38135.1 L-threonine synthase [Marichromatium gracile]